MLSEFLEELTMFLGLNKNKQGEMWGTHHLEVFLIPFLEGSMNWHGFSDSLSINRGSVASSPVGPKAKEIIL